MKLTNNLSLLLEILRGFWNDDVDAADDPICIWTVNTSGIYPDNVVQVVISQISQRTGD